MIFFSDPVSTLSGAGQPKSLQCQVGRGFWLTLVFLDCVHAAGSISFGDVILQVFLSGVFSGSFRAISVQSSVLLSSGLMALLFRGWGSWCCSDFGVLAVFLCFFCSVCFLLWFLHLLLHRAAAVSVCGRNGTCPPTCCNLSRSGLPVSCWESSLGRFRLRPVGGTGEPFNLGSTIATPPQQAPCVMPVLGFSGGFLFLIVTFKN